MATQQLDVQPEAVPAVVPEVTSADLSVATGETTAETTAETSAETPAAAVALTAPEPASQPMAPTEPMLAPQPVVQPPAAPEVAPMAAAPMQPEVEPQPVVIPVAEQAPLVAARPAAESKTPSEPSQLLGLPLQLVNQLLARLGASPLQSLAELLPALRIVTLLVVAGITIKLTGATLGAINELPLVGRLLELVGLISALNFLARNATKSQKRAELLARIQKLKRDLLG